MSTEESLFGQHIFVLQKYDFSEIRKIFVLNQWIKEMWVLSDSNS